MDKIVLQEYLDRGGGTQAQAPANLSGKSLGCDPQGECEASPRSIGAAFWTEQRQPTPSSSSNGGAGRRRRKLHCCSQAARGTMSRLQALALMRSGLAARRN